MEINDQLLEQWEAKVQRLLQNTYVLGMDREDIAQELRIAIIKAATNFDENNKKGAIFHTYLHTVMVNTLRTLISKAQKSKNIHEAYNIDGIDLDFDSTNGFISSNLAESLTDSDSLDFMTNIEIKDIIERINLSQHELDFLELRLEGTPMERISELLDVPAYKIRSSIQRKVVRFLKDNDAKKES